MNKAPHKFRREVLRVCRTTSIAEKQYFAPRFKAVNHERCGLNNLRAALPRNLIPQLGAVAQSRSDAI
jgi:hypothetical protein